MRVRQNWRLLALCAAFLVLLVVWAGTVRVRPLVIGDSDLDAGRLDAGRTVLNVAGRTELFDHAAGHRMELRFQPPEYQRMLDGYASDGDKAFVPADLTIDGTLLPSVGIRLKGNSSLATLTRNGHRLRSEPFDTTDPADPADQLADDMRSGPGAALRLRAEDPQRLPWLIRFDEYQPGLRYQGHRELALRVGGPLGGGVNLLNEAVSLQLVAATGQVAPRFGYTSLTVNGRPAVSRLVVENPDEYYTRQLPGRGVLYKARASGRMADRGDDPLQYRQDFEQITRRGSHDLQPVIDFVHWVTRCSDAEFERQLGDQVDLPGLATYLATQSLLANYDDMAGPGNNFYLWYDLGSRRFRVLGWDYNLAMTGDPEQNLDQPAESDTQSGAAQSGTAQAWAGNPLKQRFMSSAAFRGVYQSAYQDLYTRLYAQGSAVAAVEDIAGIVGSTAGSDLSAVAQERGRLVAYVSRRGASLAGNPMVASR